MVFGERLDKFKNMKDGASTGKISVDDLTQILGPECHVFKKESSSTQHCIIGTIRVFHRQKKLSVFGNKCCPRY